MPVKSRSRQKPVDVAVIGMGLMGRSIAACLLAAGHCVTGVTDDLKASSGAKRKIRSQLAEMKREGLLRRDADAVVRGFTLTANIADVSGCKIIFETITEDIAAKRRLYAEVEAVVSSGAIIASNTSAIPISLLQEGASHPERFLGIHWDEPAHVTSFMEIIAGPQTAARYMRYIHRLAVAWGKEPSLLWREIRGFISNRISYAMFREACHLVDSGVCTVEDVDRSLRNDVGWWSPFAGPFRYMDLMGVAAYLRVMKDLLPDLTTSPEVPAIIRRVVESGGRGISNGRGFYRYTKKEAEQWERRYTEFNYRIRKLTAEFSEKNLAKRSR